MKKLLGLSLLAAITLSGCAVYPSGYVESSGYTYSQPVGSVYVDETYVNRFPDTYIWVNREPRWHDYPYYHRGPYNRPPVNGVYPHPDYPHGDYPHHNGMPRDGEHNGEHNIPRDSMNNIPNNGVKNRFNMGPAVRPMENTNK